MQKYCKILLIILIPVLVYLFSFGILIYDSSFYTKLTQKYSLMPEKAAEMNKDMVNYFITGQVPASFNEFNEREMTHLQDVRTVIHYLLGFFMIALVYFIVSLRFIKDKRKIFLYGGIISVVLPVLFLILPFDCIFSQMHSLFFAKGTWIFQINDLLVNLYPLEFFQAFAKSIILRGFCLGLVITAFSSKKLRLISFTTIKYTNEFVIL